MRLVPSVSGRRHVAYEVMLGTSAIKTSVREGKTHQIDNIIQTSTEMGMNTLEMSLANLVKDGKISLETAQAYSLRPEELNRLVRSGR
jgi:twitching motility protein PilT